MNTRFTFEVLALAGITAGLAVTSGCKTAYSDSNDLSLRPQPQSLAPATVGEVTYATPESEKPLPYWKQDPGAVAALDKVAASKATGKYGSYTIKSGDTLSKIAVANGVRTADIVAVNPGLDANKIKAGQTIVLPSGAKASAAAAPKAKTVKASTSAGGTYVVKSGDILGRIAKEHGVKVADLKKANNLTSDKIKVGQKLVIPGQKATAAPAIKPAPVVDKKASAKDKPAAQPKAKPTDPVVKPVEEPVAPVVTDVPPPPAPVVEPVEITPPAPQASAVSSPSTGFHLYTVKPDQDLYDIAVQWSVGIDDIKSVNNLDSDEIHPGQVLRIPNASTAKAQ